MVKRLTGVAMVFVFAAMGVSASGCGKKAQCKKYCQMVKKCTDEIVRQSAKASGLKTTDDAYKTLKDTISAGTSDVSMCTDQCKNAKGKMKKVREAMLQCAKKSDCKTFAKCYMEVSKKAAKAEGL